MTLNPPVNDPKKEFDRASGKQKARDLDIDKDKNAEQKSIAYFLIFLLAFGKKEIKDPDHPQRRLFTLLGFDEPTFNAWREDIHKRDLTVDQAVKEFDYSKIDVKEGKKFLLETLPKTEEAINGLYNFVGAKVWEQYQKHLKIEEGRKNIVYLDSLGKLSLGVGHLVKPGENFKLGQKVSDQVVNDLLAKDSMHAFMAAVSQMNELDIKDSKFLVVLASVNFQLGTNWRNKFSDTWRLIKEGKFDEAISKIESSLWMKQTPRRAKQLIEALENLSDKYKDGNHKDMFRESAEQDICVVKQGDNVIVTGLDNKPTSTKSV
jgi:lysozyme